MSLKPGGGQRLTLLVSSPLPIRHVVRLWVRMLEHGVSVSKAQDVTRLVTDLDSTANHARSASGSELSSLDSFKPRISDQICRSALCHAGPGPGSVRSAVGGSNLGQPDSAVITPPSFFRNEETRFHNEASHIVDSRHLPSTKPWTEIGAALTRRPLPLCLDLVTAHPYHHFPVTCNSPTTGSCTCTKDGGLSSHTVVPS